MLNKKILFRLSIIGIFMYIFIFMFMYRGVLVSISVEGDNNVDDIVLYYTNKKINMNHLERHQEIDIRIRPTGESTIKLKYKIVNIGCFRVDVDTYIEPGWVGNADISILENGNISYRDKMYFTFIDPFIIQRSWRRKLVTSEKIPCTCKTTPAVNGTNLSLITSF